MDTNDKGRIVRGDLHDLADQRRELTDIVDLLTDNITARDVRVDRDRLQNLKVFPHIVERIDLILQNRQRNAADRRKEAHRDTGFSLNFRHDFVHLPQHFNRGAGLDKRRVRDFDVLDAAIRVGTSDPEQLVLEKRVVHVYRILPIILHPVQGTDDVTVGDLVDVHQLDLILGRRSLRENVAVQVDFFEVGEDRLTILQDRERIADPRNVVSRMVNIMQDQIRKVDERVVIDLADLIFSFEGRVSELRLDRLTLRSEGALLRLGQLQPEFFDVIERVADLVMDPQCNEKVRTQIRVHMGMQVRVEFIIVQNVGFNNGLLKIQPVILGLAH